MKVRVLAVVAGAAYAVALLAGCSTRTQVPGSPNFADEALPIRADVIENLSRNPGPVTYEGRRDLYVVDGSEVELFKNHGYVPDGTITYGVGGGGGDFLDASGNLYVADFEDLAVHEFPPGGSAPSFTYSEGMTDPVNVTVDRKGNVFEADFAKAGNGFVNEYARNVDVVLHHCSPGGAVLGVAVDSANDVFVDSYTGSKALVFEYKGGLSGCHATKLGLTLRSAGGMAIDRNANLLICDQTTPAVDVVAPPYQRVTRVIGSGYVDPYNVAINRVNTKVFVADIGGGQENAVDVIKYSNGTVLKRLGSAQGLFAPTGVTDGPNAVYGMAP